ncbi:MAG: hypothetical protein J0L64_08210 [Acidobacteria bacterium]|nr:hypothetical protein [Acidobacteriota bacterium]
MSAAVLYFAPGSGLGHLTRALAVCLELRELGVEAEIATNSPFAQPLARLARIRVTQIANDQWSAAAPRLLAERAPRAAVVDTFPNGLRGEWLQRPDVPLIHMARRLRLENYAQFATDGAAWRGFALTVAIEALAPEHEALLSPPVHALRGLIRLAPGRIGGAGPERLLQLLDNGAALVVHGGPREEVAQLVANARARSSAEVAAITPWQLDGVACFDYFPAANVLARASHIFTGGGYNSIADTMELRPRHTALAFPRRFDDQAARLAAVGTADADATREAVEAIVLAAGLSASSHR